MTTAIYQRGKVRLGIPMHDHSVYTMRGKFQQQMTHGVAPEDPALGTLLHKKGVRQIGSGPRLSLTFRYNGESPQPAEGKSNLEVVWDNAQGSTLAVGEVQGPSFAQVYADVEALLVPDVTKMMGKVYLNQGRLCTTFTLDKLATYSYGGSSKTVHPLDIPSIQEYLVAASMITGCAYNWVHVVYYPDGQCKLGARSDDEPSIAAESTIAGVSLYENKADFRCMEFAPKKAKRKGQA
jgi:hypothetical protein